jgi:hypothetical protein
MLDQAGSVRIAQPARAGDDRHPVGLPSLIEVDVAEALVRAVRLCGWLLGRVDPVQRLTDVVPVAQLDGAG